MSGIAGIACAGRSTQVNRMLSEEERIAELGL